MAAEWGRWKVASGKVVVMVLLRGWSLAFDLHYETRCYWPCMLSGFVFTDWRHRLQFHCYIFIIPFTYLLQRIKNCLLHQSLHHFFLMYLVHTKSFQEGLNGCPLRNYAPWWRSAMSGVALTEVFVDGGEQSDLNVLFSSVVRSSSRMQTEI